MSTKLQYNLFVENNIFEWWIVNDVFIIDLINIGSEEATRGENVLSPAPRSPAVVELSSPQVPSDPRSPAVVELHSPQGKGQSTWFTLQVPLQLLITCFQFGYMIIYV